MGLHQLPQDNAGMERINSFIRWGISIMKWEVQLYVGGTIFKEEVYASNYQDAKETAIARNPKAKVISVNPIPWD